jgi:hypothetical protein
VPVSAALAAAMPVASEAITRSQQETEDDMDFSSVFHVGASACAPAWWK